MGDPEAVDENRCKVCGTVFSDRTSPLGLCPACLLKLGVSDPAWPKSALLIELEQSSPERPEGTTPGAVSVPGDRSDEPLRKSAPDFNSERHHPRRFSRWIWVVPAAMLLAALAAFLVFGTRSTARGWQAPIVRFSIPLPDEVDLPDGAQFAVAPDGKRIVLAGRSQGRQLLWIRALASTEWQELPQTEGAAFPFWSPDSQHVGFFASKRLRRIELSSGATYTVCEAPAGRGGTWTLDNAIVFAPDVAGQLMRVSAAGGTPQPATMTDGGRHERAHRWPWALPDPQRFTYVAVGTGDNVESQGTFIASTSSGSRLLVPGGGSASFARGYLIFARGSSLMAQPFDVKRSELSGDAQFVRGGEQLGGGLARGSAFSVSDEVLVYANRSPSIGRLEWFDREGRVIGSVGDAAEYGHFSLAPDRRIAAARRDARDGSSKIWVLEAGRDAATPVTTGPSADTSPIWSPDSLRIAFISNRGKSSGLYSTPATGGGREELLLQSSDLTQLTSWSRDGRVLLYSAISPKTKSDVWMLPLGEDRRPQPVVQTPFNESDGRLSPDGRWVAYVSDETGRDEVFVRAFPQSDGRWQISTRGGTRPRWRDDGRELYFASDEGMLFAASADVAPSAFRAGSPRPLFQTRGATDFEGDTRGFLVNILMRERGDHELQVVLNWASELRR